VTDALFIGPSDSERILRMSRLFLSILSMGESFERFGLAGGISGNIASAA
jgi:hypothetical protein